MRIGFFTNNYLPRPSGVAHAIENARLELEKLGHDVFVFAPRYSKKDKENEKLFRYRSIRTHKKLGPLSSIPFPHSAKIKKLINELGLDIIHSHHPYLLGKTAQKYAQELEIPLVSTLHTAYHQYSGQLLEGLGDLVDDLVLEVLFKYIRKCNALIVSTNEFRKKFSVDPESPHIHVLPSGIDVNRFSKKNRDKAKKKLKFKNSDIVLLTVARLSYEKNVDFIIEVFSKLARINENVRLIIVGGGPQKLKLQSLAKSLGVKDKINFTGKAPYSKLHWYYGASDLFLYASSIDAQGLVLCEAMASGLPILSTNQAVGPKNLIKNNYIGYLIKPDPDAFSQKVIDLIEDKEKRQEFSRNARKEAKKYDRGILAKKLEKIYLELVKK